MRPNCVTRHHAGRDLQHRSPPAHRRFSSRYRAPCGTPYGAIHARSTATAAQIVSCVAEAPRHLARGVIDHRDQTARRPPVFIPRVKTPIELHELAEMRLALATLAIGRSLPRPTPQARRQHPPTQRLVIDVHVVLAGQVLGRQRRPKARAGTVPLYFWRINANTRFRIVARELPIRPASRTLMLEAPRPASAEIAATPA